MMETEGVIESGASNARIRPLNQTLKSYGRSVAGALVFALPAVYTMEIWWRGYAPNPLRLIFLLGSGFVLLCMYEYYTGMHGKGRKGLGQAIGEASEGLLIGLICTWAALWTLDVLPEVSSLREWIGKIVSEGVAVAIGVAIGDSQLGRPDEDDDDETEEGDDHDDPLEGSHHKTLHQFAFSVMGAVVISAGIIPTEEVVQLAYGLSAGSQVMILILSFSICLAITSMVDFRGTSADDDYTGGPLGAAAVTYLGAFVTTIGLLATSGALTDGSLSITVAKIIVAGLPSCVGAAAGKVLIS